MTMIPSFRQLVEKIEAADSGIRQIKLPTSPKDLTPVFSEKSIDLHYGVLYKNYVKKALAGEGAFQVAGAKLHTLFFEQFQIPKTPNIPTGKSKELINDKFGSFQNFKDKIIEIALSFHGSGWIYLSKSGKIKTIENHKIEGDIALLIDLWEHSFILDYGSKKETYLKEIWKIIDWEIVSGRLE